MSKLVGILALQGDFEAHSLALEKLHVKSNYVTTAAHIEACDALIIPGGETTTMLRLIEAENLFATLKEFPQKGPLFGTCAGAILLAQKATNPPQKSLGIIDITVERNSYGRQLASNIKIGTEKLSNTSQEMVFIRAPRIIKVGKGVKVLAECDGEPVCVEQNNAIAATFHPELSDDLFWHRYFVEKLT